MGGSQSGEAEREVTVEEQEREDGQPQIIVRAAATVYVERTIQLASLQVTQDFLRYVQDQQQEGEGRGEATQNKTPPPYPLVTDDELPRVTAEDLVMASLSN